MSQDQADELPSYTTLRSSSDLFTEPSSPTFSHNHRHTIEILHPGYTDRNNILLTLHAPDILEGGLYYDFAHQAAAIVTGNHFQGYFSRTTFGQRINVPQNAVLKPGRYYFHTGTCCEGQYDGSLDSPSIQCRTFPDQSQAIETRTNNHIQYPVIPRFQLWPFPHSRLPRVWEEPIENLLQDYDREAQFSDISGAVAGRDKTCRATGAGLGVEAAHLCPKTYNEWFHWHRMDRYNRNRMLPPPSMIDDLSNLILLRADVHKVFDSRRLVFFPKVFDSASRQNSNIVIHALQAHQELVTIWHNRPLLEMRGIAAEHLFTRFAVCIFAHLEAFMACGVERMVLIPNAMGELETKKWSSKDCMAFGSMRLRPQSPRKRPAPEPELEADSEQMRQYDASELKHKRYKRQRSSLQSEVKGREGGLTCNPCLPIPQDTETASSTSSFTVLTNPVTLSPPHKEQNPFLDKTQRADSISLWTGAQTGRGEEDCKTVTTFQPSSALQALVTRHLELERQLSDPNGAWLKQQEWASKKLEGAMTSTEAGAVWSILGGEEVAEDWTSTASEKIASVASLEHDEPGGDIL